MVGFEPRSVGWRRTTKLPCLRRKSLTLITSRPLLRPRKKHCFRWVFTTLFLVHLLSLQDGNGLWCQRLFKNVSTRNGIVSTRKNWMMTSIERAWQKMKIISDLFFGSSGWKKNSVDFCSAFETIELKDRKGLGTGSNSGSLPWAPSQACHI